MIREFNIQYAADGRVQAAGPLVFAEDTKRFLIGFRGDEVVDGNCWCGFGGKMESGESAEETSARELMEEVGYKGSLKQIPLLVYQSESLQFYNFLGIVKKQFIPTLNWESNGYMWTDLSRGMTPLPIHYGLLAVLNDETSRKLIAEHTGVDANSLYHTH